MSIETFDALCAGLAELAGACVQDGADEEADALEFDSEGVKVVVSQRRGEPGSKVMLTASLGPLPGGRELDAVRRLMEANAAMGPGVASFGFDPASGEVQLCESVELEASTVVEVFQRIVSLREAVCRWRDGHFSSFINQANKPEERR